MWRDSITKTQNRNSRLQVQKLPGLYMHTLGLLGIGQNCTNQNIEDVRNNQKGLSLLRFPE